MTYDKPLKPTPKWILYGVTGLIITTIAVTCVAAVAIQVIYGVVYYLYPEMIMPGELKMATGASLMLLLIAYAAALPFMGNFHGRIYDQVAKWIGK